MASNDDKNRFSPKYEKDPLERIRIRNEAAKKIQTKQWWKTNWIGIATLAFTVIAAFFSILSYLK